MSRNNEKNEQIEAGPEPLPSGNQPDSNNRASFEDLSQAHAVLSDIKNDIQAKEVIIDVEKVTVKDDVAANGDKKIEKIDYLIYGYYRQQIQSPKNTLVMMNTQGVPSRNLPLPELAVPPAYEPSSRNGFVRLTLSIVLVMLLITAGFVILVLTSDDLTEAFRRKGMLLALPAMVVMLGLSYAVACSPCTKTFPCNIIILFLAVVCMSVVCAWITSRYHTEIVCMALVATCVVVIVCILLAFSGFDFTAWMLYVVVIGAAFGALTLIVFITMIATGTYMKTLHLVILFVGTLLNVIMLTIELQMILGGGAVELGEDEYALGAFMVYTSIIDIFLKLVQILGIMDFL